MKSHDHHASAAADAGDHGHTGHGSHQSAPATPRAHHDHASMMSDPAMAKQMEKDMSRRFWKPSYSRLLRFFREHQLIHFRRQSFRARI